jgi:hypothetical protein
VIRRRTVCSASVLVTFIRFLCILRTQILRSICYFTYNRVTALLAH